MYTQFGFICYSTYY